MEWQPIDTAPKGGGAVSTLDPNWVEPPYILLLFSDGKVAVCYWDWYYAEGRRGFNEISAWIEPISGEQIALNYDEPTHWMPIPDAPKE